MTTYALAEWGWTLLALAALALAGGWVLIPFRSPDRPYLWLTAPLAGLAAVAGGLVALFYVFRLPFGLALWVDWLGCCTTTAACLVRSGLQRPNWRQVSVALAVLLAGSAAATAVSNRWTFQAGEPTISTADGSDAFGYSLVGDWLREHPACDVPGPDQPLLALQSANLRFDYGRPGSFLMAGVAGAVRNRPCVFAYDWACGVALGAALVGLGGLFASRPGGLALLLAAGATSAWLALSRNGYFARSLAFPGALLLGGLYVYAWHRPSRARVCVLCLVGPAVAFFIHPAIAVVVLGLLASGLVTAVTVARLGKWSPSERRPVVRSLLLAVALYLLAAGPSYLTFRLLTQEGYPRYVQTWDFVFPVALDLENACLPLVGADQTKWLVAVYFLVTGLLLGIAWRKRDLLAIPFLLCPALVPACWVMGLTGVYGFQGLLYPLTLCGAALLVGRCRWGLLAGVLALILVSLHVPQVVASGKRYLVKAGPSYPVVQTRGECAAIRKLIGSDAVDVYLGDVPDNHLVLCELAARGTDVRLRTPTWERSLINWAKVAGCTAPDGLPKSRYSLLESNAYAPPGSVRFRGQRLMLCEDGDRVTFRGFHEWEVICWDEQRRPGFWLRRSPVAVEIYNGTGQPAAVHFLAEARQPAGGRQVLTYRLDHQAGRFEIGSSGTGVRLPLLLPPGLNRLEVRVDWESSPPQDEKALLLWLTNLRLEEEVPSSGLRP